MRSSRAILFQSTTRTSSKILFVNVISNPKFGNTIYSCGPKTLDKMCARFLQGLVAYTRQRQPAVASSCDVTCDKEVFMLQRLLLAAAAIGMLIIGIVAANNAGSSGSPSLTVIPAATPTPTPVPPAPPGTPPGEDPPDRPAPPPLPTATPSPSPTGTPPGEDPPDRPTPSPTMLPQ
jgi:hypothetical protein